MKREIAGMAVWVFAAALVCAAAPEAHARKAKKKKFARDEGARMVEDMIQEAASKDPGSRERMESLMAHSNLDAKTVAERRLAGVTPANVQQYAPSGEGKSRPRSLGAVSGAAADAIDQAVQAVEVSREEAEDEPQQYTAEKGAELVARMADLYNESSQEIKERVQTIRAKISKMVAIALIINAGGGGQAGAQQQPGKNVEQARDGSGYLEDAPIGRAAMNQARPEIPISKEGARAFEEAEKLVLGIDPFLQERAAKLSAISAEIAALQAKESEYHRGMKGSAGGQGTGAVLSGTEEAVGQYFVGVSAVAKAMTAFVKGRGRTIYDVVQCAQDLYNAGEGLTRADLTYQQQLDLSRRALDSNQKAARGVGPMAGEWYGLLAVAEMKGMRQASRPDYETLTAPEGGESQTPDTEGTEQFMHQETEKVPG